MTCTSEQAAKGSDHGRAKLTEEDVRLIRALKTERDQHRQKAADLSMANVASKFGISQGHVRKIWSGETWSHISD